MACYADRRIKALAGLIQLVSTGEVTGIKALEGKVPEPDWVELVEALKGTPEKLPVRAPRGLTEAERLVFLKEKVKEILSPCGGWSGVVKAVEGFKKRCPDKWSAFRRYCWVKNSPARFLTVTELADELFMDRSTLPRLSRRVCEMVAHEAVAGEPY